MKPPVPYFGSKGRIAPRIVSLLPDHEHYVEPYCGSLAVLMAKRPSPMETVNDRDGDLMTFWRVLRDRPADLIRACALTPHSRAEYDAAFEPAEDELETARRIWCRLTQGRGGAIRPNGWRHFVTPDSGFSMPSYLDGYRDRLAAAAERLHAVSLESMLALDVIAKYGSKANVLLYVDPPYLGSTRGGSSRYRHEMPHPKQHQELGEALAACRAAVVLSGYHSPMYDDLYAGWHRYEMPTMTGNATGDKTRLEVLWSNRELTAQADLFEEVPA